MIAPTKQNLRRLTGKRIIVVKKDGSVVSGKLVRLKANQYGLRPVRKGKAASTKAIIPLVLFDLLAIGTHPYAYYGGYGGYGGFGYGGYGYPGFGPGYFF